MSTSHSLRFALTGTTLLALAACATMSMPTPEQRAAADYGAPIAQADAEAAAVAFLATKLKDPDSAKYSWMPIHQGFIKDGIVYGGNTYYGYELDGYVNSKNSYGGYTGAMPFVFLFQNGNLVKATHQQNTSYGPIMEPLL